MPTPARTSLAEITSATRQLIETGGLDGLTMQHVASSVGIKAPSLYKHVQSRGDLVRLVIEDVAEELGRTLQAALTGQDPIADTVALARSFREFAHGHPEAYRLMFAAIPDEWRPDPSIMAAASQPALETTSALVGPADSLNAARLLTAWVHGFVTMELAGAFRLDGDIGQAFEFGIERLVAALSPD
jgi:AcrR family transcriptional regulator